MSKLRKSKSGKVLPKGISERSDGRFHARATVNGQKVELYSRDLKQLVIDFEKAKAEASNEKNEEGANKDMTFSEFFDMYFETYKKHRLKSEVSQSAYYRRVKNTYCDILGNEKVSELTHFKIQSATNELTERKYTYRTIREALGAVREALNIGIVNGVLHVNPVVSINIKKENEIMRERRILEQWEIPLFLSEAKKTQYSEMFQIMLNSGMRVGEAAALMWDDIDFDKKVIRINKSLSLGYLDGKKIEIISSPKSRSSYREIPFFDGVEELFKQWKVRQDADKKKLGDRWRAKDEFSNIVFSTSLGSPASRYAISHALEKIERNMRSIEEMNAKMEGRKPREVVHLHPHMLRHTFCSLCFEQGMSAPVIQEIMGHSDFSVTASYYIHVSDDKRKEEIAKVGRLLE